MITKTMTAIVLTMMANIAVAVDNYAGPVPSVVAGASIDNCPETPAALAVQATVSSISALNSAVSGLAAGEAVVLEPGTYAAGNINVTNGGGDGNPIYIVCKTIEGCELGIGYWNVNASNVVISGFKRTGGREGNFTGDKITYACNKNDHLGVPYITGYYVPDAIHDGHNNHHIHNNSTINVAGNWYFNLQANYTLGICTACSNKNHNIHNNYVATRVEVPATQNSAKIPGGTASGERYAMQIGNAYGPSSADPAVFSINPKNVTGHLIANNRFDWVSSSDQQPIQIKSSGNEIRSNCFTGSRPINVRSGHGNEFTGNWYRNAAAPRSRMEGDENLFAFNYIVGQDNNQWSAIEFWRGQGSLDENYWSHYGSHNSTYAYNVLNGHSKLVHIPVRDDQAKYPNLGNGRSTPSGNVIKGNHLYSAVNPIASLYYSNPDDPLDEATFLAANPLYDVASNTREGGVLSDSECFNPALFDGPVGTVDAYASSRQGERIISPPSYWPRATAPAPIVAYSRTITTAYECDGKLQSLPCTTPPASGAKVVPVPAGYTVIFEDLFDTPVANGLPSSKWGYRDEWINNESQSYVTDADNNGHVKVEPRVVDGVSRNVLVLRTAKEAAPFTSTNTNAGSNQFSWRGGAIQTRVAGNRDGNYTNNPAAPRVGMPYGRYEIRMKLPSGRGSFPAAWLLGRVNNEHSPFPGSGQRGWPYAGELDIIEHLGREEADGLHKTHHTVHRSNANNAWPTSGVTGNGKALGFHKIWNEPVSQNWHVFRVDWFQDKIVWYVDDVVVDQVQLNLSGSVQNETIAGLYRSDARFDTSGELGWPWDFDNNNQHHLILNMAVGSTWAGQPLATATEFELLIDYVRVYGVQ